MFVLKTAFFLFFTCILINATTETKTKFAKNYSFGDCPWFSYYTANHHFSFQDGRQQWKMFEPKVAGIQLLRQHKFFDPGVPTNTEGLQSGPFHECWDREKILMHAVTTISIIFATIKFFNFNPVRTCFGDGVGDWFRHLHRNVHDHFGCP